MPDPPPARARGACLCGAVTFSISLPTRFCGHCHCTICQRAHGAGYVTWLGADRSGFAIETGADALVRYESSDHGSRSFCGRCGSSLFCELDEDPEQVDIVLANMIDAIDRPPGAHVFFTDRAAWTVVTDGLPQLGGASGLEPLRTKDQGTP